MLKNKKATLETNEMIGFIIGVAVFLILTILFKELIFSFLGSNNLEESSDSYFNTFTKEVFKADEGNIGEFTMFQRIGDSGEVDVFLIYFGDRYAYQIGDRKFISTNNKNSICVCFWDGDAAVCDRKNCMDLSVPVNFEGDYGQWAISTGDQITIERGDEEYIFSKTGKNEDEVVEDITRSIPVFLREVRIGDIVRDKDDNKFEVVSSDRSNDMWEITIESNSGVYEGIVSFADSKLVNYEGFEYYINETKSGEILY